MKKPCVTVPFPKPVASRSLMPSNLKISGKLICPFSNFFASTRILSYLISSSLQFDPGTKSLSCNILVVDAFYQICLYVIASILCATNQFLFQTDSWW